MSEQEIHSYTSKEKGSLPRILLLDCEDSVRELLEQNKFQVFSGRSGFTDGIRYIPRDSSEIDLVFWDVSKFSPYYTENPHDVNATKDDKLNIAEKSFEDFLEQILNKEGFISVFLGEECPKGLDELLSGLLYNYYYGEFGLKPRYSHSVILKQVVEAPDIFYLFFQRHVDDKDIHYILERKNDSNVKLYFRDEDKNSYAFIERAGFLISPKLRDINKGILSLLQDVLPNICGENIYPDLHQYKWLDDDFYKPKSIQNIETELEDLQKEYQIKYLEKAEELEKTKKQVSYLNELLFKDDSPFFPEGEKLKDVITKTLESDLGFQNIIDIDKERLKNGLALKEDLRIEDKIFIEVKGSETGASQDWVNQLSRHINQYCTATNTDLRTLKQVIVFNHERRKDPRTRTEPYKSDPEFLKQCERDQIALIPTFELYKIAVAVRIGKLTKERAQELIKSTNGLLSYEL